MSRKPSAYWVIFILGFTLLSTVVVPIETAEMVLDTSFNVESGATYGPYDDGTTYHTMIFGSSILRGEVTVQNGSVYLTVGGEHSQHLVDIFVDDHFEFIINPAIDQYTFTFENADEPNTVSVIFKLEESWIRPISLSSGATWRVWLIGVVLFLIAITGVGITRLNRNDIGSI